MKVTEESQDSGWADAWSVAVAPLWLGEVLPHLLEEGALPDLDGQTGLVTECRCGEVVSLLRSRWKGLARLMAVDPDRNMIDAARKASPDIKGPPVFFKVEGVQGLSFADDVFRVAVCLSSLHDGAAVFSALGSLRRVVEPGGSILFAGVGGDSFPLLMELLKEHGWTADEPSLRVAVDTYRAMPLTEQAIEEIDEKMDLQLVSAGGTELDVEMGVAGEVLESPIFREFFEPRLLHIFEEDMDRSAARQHLRTALNKYFANETVTETLTFVWARFQVDEPETFTIEDGDVIEEIEPDEE